MNRITDAEIIAGYVLTGVAILALAGVAVGLLAVAWSVIYPLIVMMMAAI